MGESQKDGAGSQNDRPSELCTAMHLTAPPINAKCLKSPQEETTSKAQNLRCIGYCINIVRPIQRLPAKRRKDCEHCKRWERKDSSRCTEHVYRLPVTHLLQPQPQRDGNRQSKGWPPARRCRQLNRQHTAPAITPCGYLARQPTDSIPARQHASPCHSPCVCAV